MFVGDFDLVRSRVGAARLFDCHGQSVRVILSLHRVDAELESVAGLEWRILAEPLRRRLGRGLDLAAEDDRLAILAQGRLLGERGSDAHRARRRPSPTRSTVDSVRCC